MAKGSRGDGGFLKGGIEASLKWRFFWYFSFAKERKVHISFSPINPNLNNSFVFRKTPLTTPRKSYIIEDEKGITL